MGIHGWAPHEVDQMELWQVARFLGVGRPHDEPVIRGLRGPLTLPSDRDEVSDLPSPLPEAGSSPLEADGWGMNVDDLNQI